MAEKNYSGDFIQLIRRSIAEPEPEVLDKKTQKKASKCLSNFKNKLAAYDLHNSLSLFSVLSISDDNFKCEEADIEFLFTLLSNTGFLFDEARTPLRGSLAPEEEWTQKVSMEWRDHSGYHSNGGRSSTLTLIEQGAEGQISEAEKRLFNELRSKFEEKSDEQPPKILVDLTNVAAEGNHEWLRLFLLSRFGILKDNQYTNEQQLSKMDLDLAMFRGFDAHGIMQDHNAGCDLERDGYGEPRVFTLRKVLSLLKRICDEVESDYEDAKVATAQIVSMETNDRYIRFCKIYNRLEEEKKLINDVGLNPYSHAKKWITDANGVTDYVTSAAQDMRKAAKKHGTESAIFRNVGLKHLPELPSFDKEFYAKDADFRNLVKELKEAFLTYRGNAVESSIILDDNIWEIARLSLHDAFTFFVDECDIDLTYAPVVCYLVIRKYGTAISKKRIKSTQISLFAIFDRYHMARSNKKVARQDFRLYANLRAAFSHFYGAALPGAVKMLWDDAFLSCSTYLDQQYDFLKSVINEEFGADSELFVSIRQIHACVDCNTCVNLSHSANPKIQKLIKRFSCIEGQESWEVSKKKIRKLLCADGVERYKNTLDSYCDLISRPHTTQEIVDFLNEITNPDDSAEKAQELFVNLSLNAIFPELHIPNDNTVNLLCGALINSATEYVIRLELAERCETKLYSWFTAYLNLKSDE